MWEKRYGLLRPRRTNTNIRYYEDRDVEMLRLVQRLLGQGVRISRIAGMSPEEMEDQCKDIPLQSVEFTSRLMDALVDMHVTRIESILNEAIRMHGFESTLLHIISPFLRQIEHACLADEIDEAHEACFREIVKRKTIREIEMMPQGCEGSRVIMFLPKGNRQELDHLFMHYYLRRHGQCVIDIGCDVSLSCAITAIQRSAPDFVLIVNADPVHWQFGSFVRDLATSTNLPVIISGRESGDTLEPEQENVVILDGMDDALDYIIRSSENQKN